MPTLRLALPVLSQELAPSAWAIVFQWVVGGVALFGYHAISSASSVSISPPTAQVGVPYTGTITYSGTHAGSVRSFSLVTTNGTFCIDSPAVLAPGLNAVYNFSPSYTATVTGTPTAVGTYSFTIYEWAGASCTVAHDSRSASLTVIQPIAAPTWLSTPSNVVALVGASVEMDASATGNPSPGYYWLQGINPAPASTQTNLVFNNVQLTNAGIYSVFATNSQGSISTNACLTVIVPPLNGASPGVTNYQPIGSTLSLSALVTNVPAAQNTYSWDVAYAPINVFTPGLVVSNVQANFSGPFSVFINSYLTTTNGSTVTTNYLVNNLSYDSFWRFGHPPAILVQPTNQSVSTNGIAAFTVAASGDSVMGTNYQWYFSSAPLPGNTNASLVINPASQSNLGSYFVVVTNVYGSVTSSIVSLSVSNSPPVVTTALQNKNVECGGGATFDSSVIGSAPLSYQWYVGGTAVSGATNASYSTNGVHGAGSAYTVSLIVTNSLGSVSNGCALTVVDTIPPVLTILGSNPTNVPIGAAYLDAGATAIDSCSGSVAVRAFSTVNINVTGSYFITYVADDGAGNTNTVTRTVLVSKVPCSGAPSGMVGWWPGDGSASDILGTNNGTWSNGEAYATGEVGPAFSFDGSGNNISFGTAIGNPGTNDFSVEFWLRTTYTGYLQSVIGKRAICNGSSGWDIRIGGGAGVGKLSSAILENALANANNIGLNGTKLVNDGNWHHIGMVRKTSSLYVYVDGALDVSGSAPGVAMVSNNVPFDAGINPCDGMDGTVPFNGQLDEISLYNWALSGSEIYAIYASGSFGKCLASSFLPQGPAIQIARAGNHLVLSWPVSSLNFQVLSAFTPLGPWSPAGFTVITNGFSATVTVLMTNQQRYFRLSGQ